MINENELRRFDASRGTAMKNPTVSGRAGEAGVDSIRRRLLLGASAAPLVAGSGIAMMPSRTEAALKTSARIVIAGSGLGGLAIASRLSRELDGAQITVVDRKEEHNYQPGYTLVATGVWDVAKVSDRNADLMPQGVEWVREMAAEFDPEANRSEERRVGKECRDERS